jgi:ankyrin repeat protein
LVWLALKIKEKPDLLDSSDVLISDMLSFRLLHLSPPQIPAPLEYDVSEVKGFLQMYVQDVINDQKQEPPVLKSIRGDLEKDKEMIDDDSRIRRSAMGDGWNGLHYAAAFDQPDFIPLFLEEPDAVHIDDPGGRNHRYTPLHEASWQANPSCVKKLLDHGANLNARSMSVGAFCLTPLFLYANFADSEETPETIRLLLEAGASTAFRHQGLGAAPRPC